MFVGQLNESPNLHESLLWGFNLLLSSPPRPPPPSGILSHGFCTVFSPLSLNSRRAFWFLGLGVHTCPLHPPGLQVRLGVPSFDHLVIFQVTESQVGALSHGFSLQIGTLEGVFFLVLWSRAVGLSKKLMSPSLGHIDISPPSAGQAGLFFPDGLASL